MTSQKLATAEELAQWIKDITSQKLATAEELAQWIKDITSQKLATAEELAQWIKDMTPQKLATAEELAQWIKDPEVVKELGNFLSQDELKTIISYLAEKVEYDYSSQDSELL